MSNEKHEGITLEDPGWSPARYPKGIEQVHQLWARNPVLLCENLPDLTERLSLKTTMGIRPDVLTDDKHLWYRTITFCNEGAVIAVALPYCTDFQRVDGTLTDRMCAAFTKGECSDEALAGLMENIAAGFEEIRATCGLQAA